eukprot:TRINITY_DN42222_c0_g1_i1.p1 TRINITY_DN42222_c0_g1~~TRINITY_DN42222_c0_g1_i1.p1  ORF type:complete len:646 (-),score=99.73 TRINITY_DN42222_c0_g1_i1:41-1978(-)
MSWQMNALFIMIGVSCLLLVIDVALFVRAFFSKLLLLRDTCFRQEKRTCLRRLVSRRRSIRNGKQQSAFIESEVRRIVDTKRITRFKSCSFSVRMLGTIIIVGYHLRVFITANTANREDQAIFEASSGHLLHGIMILLSSLGVQFAPMHVGLHILDISQVMIMMRLTQTLVYIGEFSPVHNVAHTVSRIFVAFLQGNARLSVVLNTVYFFVAASLRHMTFADNTVAFRFADEGFQDSAYFFADVAILGCIIIVACFLEDSCFAEAASIVEMRVAADTEKTIRSLLRALSDAVVRVGPEPDLQILEASPHLGAVLLRNPVRGFTGRSLLHLVDEHDRERLREHFADAAKNSGEQTARILHVKMVDGIGMRVGVQLFYATFTDLGGNRGSLVGVRELRDEEKASDAADGGMVRPPRTARAASMPQPVGDSSCDTTIFSTGDLQTLLNNELVVYFNCIDPTFEILRWNSAFGLLAGCNQIGQGLLKSMRSAQHFKDTVQDNVDEAMGRSQESHRFEVGSIELQFPHASSILMVCVATCLVEIPVMPSMQLEEKLTPEIVQSHSISNKREGCEQNSPNRTNDMKIEARVIEAKATFSVKSYWRMRAEETTASSPHVNRAARSDSRSPHEGRRKIPRMQPGQASPGTLTL